MNLNLRSLIILFTILIISQNLLAQQQFNRHERNKNSIQEKLNLTDEQKDLMDALWITHKKDMIDLKGSLEKKKLELSELKNNGDYTRAEFLEKVNAINSAKNQIALSFANHQMDIYQMLDENQQKEWNKLRMDLGDRKEKRFKHLKRDFYHD